MSGRLSRVSRAAAAAAVAGVLVLGPLGLAPAGADLSSFSSTGSGFALRVTVDFSGLYSMLPADARAEIENTWDAVRNQASDLALPENFPQVIDQYFAKTDSDAASDLTKAVSRLAEGFVTTGAVSASSVGESASESKSFTVPPVNEAVDVKVFDAVTGIVKASVAAGPQVAGEATIAEVTATLSQLASMLPVEVQSALSEVQAAVDEAIATAEAEVNAAVAGVAATIDSEVCEALPAELLALGLCESLEDTTDALQQLLDLPELPSIPDLLEQDLVKVTKLANSATAEKSTAGLSSADASSSVEAIDVLGGFVTANLINLSSHSEAAGTAGSAKNTSSCSIADVRVGDSAQITIDDDGVHVTGVELPADLPVDPSTVISTLETEIGNVLATAGLGEFELCKVAQGAAAPDGTAASQAVSAFAVTFEPKIPDAVTGTELGDALGTLGLSAGDSLVKVTIDPTVQTAVSAAAATAGAPASPVSLPRTGAPMVATVVSGLLLAVGSLSLRRRMR